jgi:hypothetical protein
VFYAGVLFISLAPVLSIYFRVLLTIYMFMLKHFILILLTSYIVLFLYMSFLLLEREWLFNLCLSSLWTRIFLLHCAVPIKPEGCIVRRVIAVLLAVVYSVYFIIDGWR